MLLYNTLSKKKERFRPAGNTVKMYTCGPTVYDYAHIGNLRTFVFEDVLKRALIYNGYKVKHVMNITDVGHLTGDRDMGEDKIEKGAKRENKTAWEIAEFYTKEFKKDIKLLNIIPPKIWCRATDHIKEQIDLIKKLEKRGYTYSIHDGVYFDTSKFKSYGALARQNLKNLEEGARVEKNPQKKHATDFALWKFSAKNSNRQMEWKSPWGTGFPGWHIECSAMSMKYLGPTFDIHCGGVDHIPVHHTNEIAQSEAAEGKPLARYWLHGEFLLISGMGAAGALGREPLKGRKPSNNKPVRMGKSEGNIITLNDLIKKGISPMSYRYFLLQTHYRKQLQFSFGALEAAERGLEHLYRTASTFDDARIGCAEFEEKFLKKINNDLDTPGAMALAWDLIKSQYPSHAKLKTLLKFDGVLGLNIENERKLRRKPVPRKIVKLLEKREAARKARDWKMSDKIRTEIEKNGYIVRDEAQGQKIIKVL